MAFEREESDQLPEEGPDPQVVDDDGAGGARESAEQTPGQPGSEGQATGNPPSDDAADDSDR
jgi:hypothetical protein